MKNILTLAFFLIVSCASFAQQISESVSTAMQSIKKDHPRLLLLKGEESQIVKQTKKYKEWNNIHQSILTECDKLLQEIPVDRIQTGRRLLGKSRECLRRVFQLSYAYRTTKEDKYLKRAEKELLAVSGFTDWNPSHFLDVAEMTMAVAIGYDWLHDDLSEESRKIIREAILKKGIEPSYDKKYNGFLRSTNNWNQVCNAGMVFGVLAIAEHEPELAAKTISRAVESLPISVTPAYKPDGAYPEGYGYWEYGTSFNVLYISAVQKALGTDFGLSQSPGFLKTAGFLQHLVGPNGLAHNWGDSGLKDGISPAMFWFADKNNDPSLLWSQKKLMSQSNVKYVNNRILPALLIWGMNADLDQIKAPETKMWVGQGDSPVGLMRTSWTDPNAIFVGVKAGSPSVSHAHMDIGSFVIDAQGERWAADFGMQDYNSLESKGVDLWNRSQNSQRWQVFRLNNFAHNTLTFDGQLQNVKGYAKIDARSADPSNPAVVTDISQLYESQIASAKRGVSIRKGKNVVVRDEVKTLDKSVNMRWNLLTPAEVKIVDGKTVELTKNGKKMFLIFETKSKIEIKTWPTTPSHDYDAPNPDTQFVGFEVTIPANSSAAFNAYFTPDGKTEAVNELASWQVK
ncbi:heparinase II/III family protein [Dyadobacter sp. CY312]|uniref:heparinase II/III domain-containing protein n=1 Tax=Dyadobacter sp. CY312 TaxID=2907303 RepID=UPI001F48B1F0|nr:heparinase II/III family protein [Dyadobacter sp. CY312]MCE7043217.1 heparinase II/III family protein [Dyadobacter sp. CY312]